MLIGTGSEVSLCVDAYEQLAKEGIRSRVVSMPSWELFERSARGVPRQRAAAGGHRPRRRRAGARRSAGSGTSARPAHVIGMHTFGASAPLKELQKKFGFAPEHVVAAAKQQLGRG